MAATAIAIAPDHPAFAGHFPGRPIVPAVVLLAETLAAVARATATPEWRWSIASAKFLQPVAPGTALTLTHHEDPAGRVRFEIRSPEALVASGQLVARP